MHIFLTDYFYIIIVQLYFLGIFVFRAPEARSGAKP
jgi:hypothetical protein